ncbi:MAG: YqaA family protein [Methylococcales bacterium]|nr:YqaA family protein [Methylococcales bacterium]
MDSMSLWGLFGSAFISSTIAPGGSEAVLAYMISEASFQTELLVLIATIGNTLGALTTWGLGVLAAKKYPLDSVLSEKKQAAINQVKKWGYLPLFFSWLPIVGDGFCFAGGWLKMPLMISILIIFFGKALRYLFIAYLFNLV